MAEGYEPQPLGAKAITATVLSDKITIDGQRCVQYGKVVTVMIRFSVTGSLDSTESMFGGLPPSPVYTSTCCHKLLGGGNYVLAMNTSGNIRNDWDGISTGQYMILFSYIIA